MGSGKPKTIKLIFPSSSLGTQQKRDFFARNRVIKQIITVNSTAMSLVEIVQINHYSEQYGNVISGNSTNKSLQ
jgi:hypothetical protein